MKYVEITQDGAGFIPNEKLDEMGLFTKDVASCAVYAIWGSNGILMIHDTAQIKLEDILQLIQKLGTVNKMLFGVNKSLENQTRKFHNERRQKIMNVSKIKKVEELDLPYGIFAMNHTEYQVTNPKNILSCEHKDKRHGIMTLNNLFSPPNSQSVKLDFQFDGEKFTDLPELQMSIAQMDQSAILKRLQGDSDYFHILQLAKQQRFI